MPVLLTGIASSVKVGNSYYSVRFFVIDLKKTSTVWNFNYIKSNAVKVLPKALPY